MTPAPIKPTIVASVLDSIDIRVGTIAAVDDVAGSSKLVALSVRFGDHDRTIVAGLKRERADPKSLAGKQALFVVNLAPRTMAAWCRRACCSTSVMRTGSCRCWPSPNSQCRTGRGRGSIRAASGMAASIQDSTRDS